MKPGEWQARQFRDPDGDAPSGVVWSDPIERLAVMGYVLGYKTPEAADSTVRAAKGREETDKTWAALLPADRQLYRRRAFVMLSIGAEEPVGA